jgi:hypothetical protein
MNRELISLRWNLEVPGWFGARKFYHEGESEPPVNVLDIAMDKLVRKITKDKRHVIAVHPVKHNCSVCGGVFWSEKKVDDKPCYRGRVRFKGPPPCYIKFYGGKDEPG